MRPKPEIKVPEGVVGKAWAEYEQWFKTPESQYECFAKALVAGLSQLVEEVLGDEALSAGHHAFVEFWAGKGTWSSDPQPPGPEQIEAMRRAQEAALRSVGVLGGSE